MSEALKQASVRVKPKVIDELKAGGVDIGRVIREALSHALAQLRQGKLPERLKRERSDE